MYNKNGDANRHAIARTCELKMPQQECTKDMMLTSPLWISMMPAWIFSKVSRSFRMSTCVCVRCGGEGKSEERVIRNKEMDRIEVTTAVHHYYVHWW